MSPNNLDQLCVNTIRMLAADMVEAANSGHPGMPMGAAPMAYVLFTKFMRFNPKNPSWAGRDRFVLSAGHGSALMYSMLHLCGYDLPMEQLKNFRQWGALTAGHPEYGLCPGVDATTGPLGHGLSMGVGMAMAERWLAGTYNRPGQEVIDHYIYGIVSDGDLMEGVASEAASLAGTLKLGKIIYLYDDNKISIEGGTDLAFTEDAKARFEAYGWQVLEVADGNDVGAIEAAVKKAQAETTRPSLIKCRTQIGYGSPKQGTAKAHGEPLGAEAMAETRKAFDWPQSTFVVPSEVKEAFAGFAERGAELESSWNQAVEVYAGANPAEGKALKAQLAGELPQGWENSLPSFEADGKIATRAASGQVLNAIAPVIPNLVGGSADLSPSNKSVIADSPDMRTPGGRNIHFGVREHGMGAIVNGMALHGGVIPYGATFFVFSDFVRPALRLSSLMKIQTIWIFTHDSVAVGEDGPTHQPIEQLMSLRVMPGFTCFRPADANETAAAWKAAVTRSGPTALILSRQGLPILDPASTKGAEKGAYVLSDCQGEAQLLLLSSGAEVHLALSAQEELKAKGVASRVVSMPSWEIFAEQDQAYRDSVIPPKVKARLAIEAGATLGWERYVGDNGCVIGLDRFGESAPGGEVLDKLGFNVDNVVAKALACVG
jgi:transketolase